MQSEEIKENEEFKKIMNKTFCQLYEEYINSNEFNNEINRLKRKMKMNILQGLFISQSVLSNFF